MTNSMTIEQQSWKAGELTNDQLVQVAELHLAAFDPKGRSVDDYIEQRLRTPWQDGQGEVAASSVLHVIFIDGELVAKAATFGRTITTEAGDRNIMGLAAVAAHPDRQGSGLGKKIVLAAFERVDNGEFFASLFQTGKARRFYERLGCRVVDNPFVDSTADDPKANPWNDDVAMIYPGDAEWPTGKIDLNGPGY